MVNTNTLSIQTILEKANSQAFVDDIRPLLSPVIESLWSLEEALTMMQEMVLPSPTDAAWKGDNSPPGYTGFSFQSFKASISPPFAPK